MRLYIHRRRQRAGHRHRALRPRLRRQRLRLGVALQASLLPTHVARLAACDAARVRHGAW